MAAGQEDAPKLIIEDLVFQNGRVAVTDPFVPGRTVPAMLPDIHLQDIGSSEGGAAPATVTGRLMLGISTATHIGEGGPGRAP